MFPRPRYVFLQDDTGQATVEYSVIVIVAATMGLILLGIVKGGAIVDALTSLIERALDVKT
jgi:Flp pilus assembly pilin Flp